GIRERWLARSREREPAAVGDGFFEVGGRVGQDLPAVSVYLALLPAERASLPFRLDGAPQAAGALWVAFPPGDESKQGEHRDDEHPVFHPCGETERGAAVLLRFVQPAEPERDLGEVREADALEPGEADLSRQREA